MRPVPDLGLSLAKRAAVVVCLRQVVPHHVAVVVETATDRIARRVRTPWPFTQKSAHSPTPTQYGWRWRKDARPTVLLRADRTSCLLMPATKGQRNPVPPGGNNGWEECSHGVRKSHTRNGLRKT